MKTNVRIKVYASRSDTVSEKASRPCFQREVYQVDTESINVTAMKEVVDFMWAPLQPKLIIEID